MFPLPFFLFFIFYNREAYPQYNRLLFDREAYPLYIGIDVLNLIYLVVCSFINTNYLSKKIKGILFDI